MILVWGSLRERGGFRAPTDYCGFDWSNPEYNTVVPEPFLMHHPEHTSTVHTGMLSEYS